MSVQPAGATSELGSSKPGNLLSAVRPALPRRLTRRRGNRLSVVTQIAIGILALILLVSIFAPLLSPYDPIVGDIAQRLKPWGWEGHLLGTDEQGRDILTRLMYGGRLSLLAAVVPVAIAFVVSLVLGLIAGSRSGIVSGIIMRVLDVFFAFPAVMFAIAVTAVLGPGLVNAFGALAIAFTPAMTRVVSSATRGVIGFEYIQAARLTGAGRTKILFRQILPNVLPTVFTYAASITGVSLLVMAGLSFIGLGVQPPTPEWGFMLGSMKDQLFTAPIDAITPGLMIFVTVVALNTASDGLRDAGDQR